MCHNHCREVADDTGRSPMTLGRRSGSRRAPPCSRSRRARRRASRSICASTGRRSIRRRRRTSPVSTTRPRGGSAAGCGRRTRRARPCSSAPSRGSTGCTSASTRIRPTPAATRATTKRRRRVPLLPGPRAAARRDREGEARGRTAGAAARVRRRVRLGRAAARMVGRGRDAVPGGPPGRPIGNISASSHHAAPCSGHPGPSERPQRRRAAGPGALPGAETARL